MAIVWQRRERLSVRDVRASVPDLAYTTVMTTLTRLHDKGAVDRQRSGRAYAYTPVLDQAGIAASRMREMLDDGQDRRAVLAHFVDSLSAQDERLLSELLRDAGGGEREEST